jgi:drug/metabolite transporter (DMT)-like permease
VQVTFPDSRCLTRPITFRLGHFGPDARLSGNFDMSKKMSSGVRERAPGFFRSPHLLTFLAVVFLGANFVVVRNIHEQYPPAVLSLWRWGGAALILLPFTWSGLHEDWPIIRRNWVVLVACALLLPIVGSLSGYLAMALTVAVNGAIIQSMMPVLVVLLSWILLNERMNARQAFGLTMALLGILGIVTRGDPEVLRSLSFNSGDLLLLASAGGIAGYYVLFKRAREKPRPLVFLTVICGIGAVFHIPFVTVDLLQGSPLPLNTATILSILFVAIFPSLLAASFFNYGIEKIGPSKASAYNYLTPVITAVLAFVFLDEAIAAFHVIGTILIIFGVYLTAKH